MGRAGNRMLGAMFVAAVLFSLLLVALLAAIVLRPCEDPHQRQAKSLDSADVESEVRDAVANGDCRPLAFQLAEFGPFVPGVPRDRTDRYRAMYGLRVILNESGEPESAHQMRAWIAAMSYAERYNAALLRKLPSPDAGPVAAPRPARRPPA